MREVLSPLLLLQRFYVPIVLLLLVWATWRTVVRKDMAVGLALYFGLVIVVDGFLNTGIHIPGLDKGSIRYSEVCGVVLLFLRPAAVPAGGLRRAIGWLVVIYFGLLLLSVFRSADVMKAAFEFRTLIVPQVLALSIASRGFASAADYQRFLRGVAALVLLIAIWDLWDIFFDTALLHSDMLFDSEYSTNHNQGRYGSIFLNPNFLGAFAVLMFPIVFVAAANESTLRFRLLLWGALLALVFCLVETQSRAPMLAFAVMVPLLVFGPCGGISRGRRLGFLVAFALVFTLFMPGFIEHAIQRFEDPSLGVETGTVEARSRQSVWVYAARIVADHPLAGVGFGEPQFVSTMDAYGFRERYGQQSLDNPHNSYLQMSVYAGIPALAAFALANLILLARASRFAVTSGESSATPLIFGTGVGVTAFLAAIYPDMHMFTRSVAPVYWGLFGLLLAMTTRNEPVKRK